MGSINCIFKHIRLVFFFRSMLLIIIIVIVVVVTYFRCKQDRTLPPRPQIPMYIIFCYHFWFDISVLNATDCFVRFANRYNCLQLFTLWSWLPVRITMYQPVLLYTTEEHGCSLTTFYVRVEQHEPTLLMIKTCNNEVHFIYSYFYSRYFFPFS